MVTAASKVEIESVKWANRVQNSLRSWLQNAENPVRCVVRGMTTQTSTPNHLSIPGAPPSGWEQGIWIGKLGAQRSGPDSLRFCTGQAQWVSSAISEVLAATRQNRINRPLLDWEEDD